ncbi:adenylate/guanylate cyclase domain-containing protein [Mitsuaria sp. 7]|uniref:adenylate/guanylate cyclase domain-containing protein n=1 Tax=Mitsuaria sp. 7 TaxID=1658665 RepID=UPI0007DD2FF7|nr:adenylate/guanylate cyclase domain-containing protein [Mitsuaria sp. 7]ANH68487.1 hypothetical protein ABE85_14580 [Mitsuaria sp. 7]
MGTSKQDLFEAVNACFTSKWNVQLTSSVPEATDLSLAGPHAKALGIATVLYADLDGSTDMVNQFEWWFSAGVYKAYLRCAASIIRSRAGAITAYDGDRVMAIFIGQSQCADAVIAAMQINCAVHEVIRPTIQQRYPQERFTLRHAVGIDRSQIRAARIGIRADNDLVWIGRAANYAAKLTSISGPPIRVTGEVIAELPYGLRVHNGNGMWSTHTEPMLAGQTIFSSDYMHTLP